jgi:hypothetical protein
MVYRGPARGIGDLWCERIQPGEIRVVYEFTDEERAQIVAGARVELAMFAEPIPPISMVVLPPGRCEPISEHGWKGQSIDDIPDRLPSDW